MFASNSEWSKTRSNYWKNEAKNNSSNYTSYDLDRMVVGKFAYGSDGLTMILHHVDGIANNMYNIIPMSRTQHKKQHMYERLFK